MADMANNMANIAGAVPRKPGRAKGSPKPEGSGRQKGTRNRVTKEIAEIAQKHGKVIVDGLVKEFKTTDDLDVKVKIASLVLSYGYGQPTRRSEVSGPDGAPIEQRTHILEASERVARVFAQVADQPDPAEAMDDDGLHAIQAINFITASQEAAQRAQQPVRTRAPAKVANGAVEPLEPVVESPPEPPAEPIAPCPISP